MSKLPASWVLTKLENVAAWGSGGTPSRTNLEYYGGDIPWFKTGELNDGVLLLADEHLTELGIKKSSAKIFSKGSVAIAMYGATIGKTGIFGVDGSTNQACAVAQTYNGINNRYLHYYLKSEKRNFIDKGKGGAQPNISQTVIKAHPFPLPPLNEQKRIVAKLDKLFAHLDNLKVRMERVPELLKQFRQSVLTQAVNGNLTEDWRGRDSISEWKKMTVDKFMVEVKDKVNPLDIEETNYVGLEHIEKDGGLTEIGNSKGLKSQKSVFKKGDVLYGKLRPYLNKHIVAPFDGICSTDILVFRHQQIESAMYFDYFLGLPETIAKANTESKGINLPRISPNTVKAFEIIVPPLEELQEIVRRVESLFEKADLIERQYELLKEKIDHLPQAILAKAFRGELVAQDSHDEPAEELLARINKTHRSSETKKTKKKSPVQLNLNLL